MNEVFEGELLTEADRAAYSSAFHLFCDLDNARATAARFRAAADRTTGVECEANIRLAESAEVEVARIEVELRGKLPQVEDAAKDADTVLKKHAILDQLRLRYPALENAWKRNEKWIKDAQEKHGRYRLEAIEAGCRQAWPKEAPARGADPLSSFGQISAVR